MLNKFSLQLINLLTTMVCARFIMPEEFGMIGVLSVFTTLATTLVDAGMGGSLIKENNITEKDCNTVYTFNLVFSIFFYIVIFIASPLIEQYFSISGLADVCRVVCIPLIINAMSIVPRTILVKQLDFRAIFIVGVISYIIAACICIILAIFDWGVWALALNYILIAIFENIGYRYMAKGKYRIRFYVSSFKKLFSFGFLTTLCSIIDTLYDNIVSLCLGKTMGPSQVGYFSQAKKIESAVSSSISKSVSNVMFSSLVKVNTNNKLFTDNSKIIQRTILALSTPILAVIIVFPEQIITVLLGKDWIEASLFLSLLSIAGFFNILEETSRTIIKSTGHANILFKATVIRRSVGFIIIIITALLNSKFIVHSFVLTSAMGAFINSIYITKHTTYTIKEQSIGILKIFLAGCTLFFIMNILKNSVSSSLLSSIVISTLCVGGYYLLLPFIGVNISYKNLRELFR